LCKKRLSSSNLCTITKAFYSSSLLRNRPGSEIWWQIRSVMHWGQKKRVGSQNVSRKQLWKKRFLVCPPAIFNRIEIFAYHRFSNDVRKVIILREQRLTHGFEHCNHKDCASAIAFTLLPARLLRLPPSVGFRDPQTRYTKSKVPNEISKFRGPKRYAQIPRSQNICPDSEVPKEMPNLWGDKIESQIPRSQTRCHNSEGLKEIRQRRVLKRDTKFATPQTRCQNT
jgi:hypothetical protein